MLPSPLDQSKAKTLKQEQFRTNIRKQKNESIFRQNRQLQPVGINPSQFQLDPKELLAQFLKDGSNLQELCDCIDSSNDLRETYANLADTINQVKQYLCQQIDVIPNQFKQILKLTNNIIIVQERKVVQQLIYDNEKQFDSTLIFQLQNILQTPESQQQHNDAILMLILLMENDNIAVQKIQCNSILKQSVIISAYNNNVSESIYRMGEYLQLSNSRQYFIRFEGQYEITQKILETTLEYGDITLLQSIIILIQMLNEHDQQLLLEMYLSRYFDKLFKDILLLNTIQEKLDFIKIFNYILKLDHNQLYMIGISYNFCQMIQDFLKQKDKELTIWCLKLIKRIYKQSVIEENQLGPQVSESTDIQLRDFQCQFLGFIYEIEWSCLMKSKTAKWIIEFIKNTQQLEEKDFHRYAEFLDSQLDEDDNDTKILILNGIEQLVSMQSLQEQQTLVKMLQQNPRFIEKICQLQDYDQSKISDQAQNLAVLLSF